MGAIQTLGAVQTLEVALPPQPCTAWNLLDSVPVWFRSSAAAKRREAAVVRIIDALVPSETKEILPHHQADGRGLLSFGMQSPPLLTGPSFPTPHYLRLPDRLVLFPCHVPNTPQQRYRLPFGDAASNSGGGGGETNI